MAEIYRDTPTQLALSLAGATNVVATVIRNGVDIMAASGSPVTLPFKVYGYDGPFAVKWEFFMPGDTVSHTRYEQHEVVTPLFELDVNATPTDIDAERKVRKIIETYCGQSFGYTYGAAAIQGNGTDLLSLPGRLISLDAVAFGDYPYSNVSFGDVALINNGWALSTAYGPTYYNIKEAPPEVDYIIPSGGLITAPGTRRIWQEGRTYLISGSWGYEAVPTEVSEAARILFDDYTCDDADLRNRYVGNMRYADTRIEFNAGAFQGTGNVLADQLLSNYRKNTMVII